ncbi:hypothetical protein BABINDRAFT_130702 [Babjeviella inositovora NRRL Y-12698]|uniref:Secreted protein n=1 Tax=Babjeviella inositovora NRRL Y-12698 TaxID=984486 RepID=A0A1E3QR95_9ASCO|nr:uncharacterized protein BABINDRAFT_130702 [Babjeviella inositovora NRRL Y-12698]ODQ80223.1 hypothetical protein BABINDRAFT_130702 [Babjeviella inositovora NRRL Y-12698]
MCACCLMLIFAAPLPCLPHSLEFAVRCSSDSSLGCFKPPLQQTIPSADFTLLPYNFPQKLRDCSSC